MKLELDEERKEELEKERLEKAKLNRINKGEAELIDEPEEIQKESKFKEFAEKPFVKKVIYFWDYYKWFVIIPTIVLIIAIAFLSDYLQENKPRLLDVALVNTYDLSVPYVEIGQNYSLYRGYAEGELPVKISANITYPKEMNEEMARDTALVSSIQKLQALFLSGNINVLIATDYAVKDFAEAGDFLVLTDCLEPEFIEKHKERLFYALVEGEEKPVGFYLEDNNYLGQFSEDEVPVIAICNFSEEEKINESLEFLKWMMMQY